VPSRSAPSYPTACIIDDEAQIRFVNAILVATLEYTVDLTLPVRLLLNDRNPAVATETESVQAATSRIPIRVHHMTPSLATSRK
jgi:hypothetical protein